MRNLLMITFHYPPFQGSSGVQRTWQFSRYLPQYDWQPIVLTAAPSAYPQVVNDDCIDIPANVTIERTFALDTARHLAVRGAYWGWLALPDRWVSWWPSAVIKGLRLIRKYRPEVIWSTYPIATAHFVGLTLHRLTGIPWIADCRDPMVDVDPLTGVEYPLDPAVRRINGWIERAMVKHSAHVVFTAPTSLVTYAERYPAIPRQRWVLIENGYDEESFLETEKTLKKKARKPGPLVLLHSGALQPAIRNPSAFFAALADLKRGGAISPITVKIILRASGNEEEYRSWLRDHDIVDLVFLEPPLPYREALKEMLTADGLLLFQSSNCNLQIPAKVYEYFRAQRPIFALTDARGDTAAVLKAEGISSIAPLDQKEQIGPRLLEFLDQLRIGSAPTLNGEKLETYSRNSRTRELAGLLASLFQQKAENV